MFLEGFAKLSELYLSQAVAQPDLKVLLLSESTSPYVFQYRYWTARLAFINFNIVHVYK